MQNYSIQVTEAADSIDLTEELKNHLRLNNGTAEDVELARFVSSALSLFEFETNTIALPTTFRQHFTNWGSVLELARSPVSSITAVGYYDENDTPQTLAAYHATTNPSGWRSDLTGNTALVYLPNLAVPSTSTLRVRPVYVDFVAGAWADVDYMPDDALLACLLLASHLYANRESHTELNLNELPQGFKRVCNKYLSGKGGV